ncbi:MAG: amino acid permease [Rikenellaceae bacterium]|nr:amino acid permease [Rikenellaceae bacterium]MCL2692390.1 amino acid permease [Rikenellaceae bacterium]
MKKLGTTPVFLTSISSILGAILFLRLGMATGELGFYGVIAIIVLAHMITIPTALAISELATNTRVEGGGEYFIMSRSFGLKIGSTIGITLFLSQAISIAFYIIAFAEAFYPFFNWFSETYGWELPRQVVSVPTLLILAYIVLKRGLGSSIKLLYIINILLVVALALFFLGKPLASTGSEAMQITGNNFGFFNRDKFFIIFAICFPAFTGMTAGVGLSGDLRNPGRSIPIGTMLGTLTGLVVYTLVVWKFAVSASPQELLGDQLIMSRIALLGALVIPVGLITCTSSAALGFMMVAPRTLQAIARDRTFPFRRLNIFFSRGRGQAREPRNASLISFAIAFVFILLGDVNSVAAIISMFFLITYGTMCLSSFLNHFGSPPSYRPRFRSRWFLSLAGFVLSMWVMFMIDPLYTVVSYMVIILIYLYLERTNKDKKGLVNIFKGALFQLNRHLQVYMQKSRSSMEKEEWRPAALCMSLHSFDRPKVLEMMKWISRQHGFGTYFHLIEGYYSQKTHTEAQEMLARLVETQREEGGTLYIDTMISPSYTSAIAQAIQAPSISGMENNMVIFEYAKDRPRELHRILENVNLVRAGNFDVGIYAVSDRPVDPANGIHVWMSDIDDVNTNFMILLGYIILSHPTWRHSHIKIFITSLRGYVAEVKEELRRRIEAGRLPITMNNIEIVVVDENHPLSRVVETFSREAGLTIFGFPAEIVRHPNPVAFFSEFNGIGDVLFVNSLKKKEIT